MSDWTPSGAQADAFTNRGGSDNADHVSATDAEPTSAPAEGEDNAAFVAKVKEAGWIDNVPIDYSVLNGTDGNFAEWHAKSDVYEWKEEYGEVGPDHERLEKALFGGEYRMKKGTHIANLQFAVVVDGPVQYKPARSVS